jgi:hypothetical protein
MAGVAVARPKLLRSPPARSISPDRPLHPVVQAKLRIGAPNDKYEQEADRVADQVMRMSEPARELAQSALTSLDNPATVQRKCAGCSSGGVICPECTKEEETLQAKETSGKTLAVTPELQTQIHSLRGSGQPLPGPARSYFEVRLAHDFGRVRVHSDLRAQKLARSVNARAFTLGNDIVFDSGQYQPGSIGGRRLLAHELTHVAQQNGGGLGPIRRQANHPAPAAPPVNAAATSPHGNNCSQSNCADKDRAVMDGDFARAQEWVTAARQALAAQPVTRRTGQLLDWYFNSQSAETISTLDQRLGCIHDSLTFARTQRWWGCDPPDENIAYADMAAAVPFCAGQRDLICLTDKYFNKNPTRRATDLIHEASHLQGFSLGVLDEGSFPDIYSWNPKFRRLTTGESLQNADSVAYFCRAVATGVSPQFRGEIEAGAGVAAFGSTTTWAARLFIGAEAEHPVLGMVNPRLGIGITMIGESLEPSSSTLSAGQGTLIASALFGVRLTDPRPGHSGGGFALFEAGPSAIIDNSVRPGVELGVAVGYRWRFLEFSARLGAILDPKNPQGSTGAALGTGGVGFNF